MNTSLIALLEAAGIASVDQLLTVLIMAQYVANPDETDQAIADNIVGAIKHNYLRPKFGFLADFIMPFIEPTLREEIAKEIPIVKQTLVTVANPPILAPAQ